MQDLRLVGVHADGEHLLFADESGERYRVLIDQPLREAIRRDRGRALRDAGGEQEEQVELRPRDVQALIRAGVSLEDVAERSGWTVEKVRRYEPPIRAERDHVALLVQEMSIGHADADGPATFGQRVVARLEQRGVPVEDITWDSWRTESDWTVVAGYPAGGRLRQATWRFDPHSQAVHPTDDEARWLGDEDEQEEAARRDGSVFDLEADGGLEDKARRSNARKVPGSSRPPEAAPDHDPEGTSPEPAGQGQDTHEQPDSATPAAADSEPQREEPVDLVSVMRQRSNRRRRSRRSDRGVTTPTDKNKNGSDAARGSEANSAQSNAADGGRESGTSESGTNESGTVNSGRVNSGKVELSETSTADEAIDTPQQALDHDPVTGTRDLFAHIDESGTTSSAGTSRASGAAAADDDDSDEIVVPSRPSGSRKGRPSVPSWDDIMFGGGGRSDD